MLTAALLPENVQKAMKSLKEAGVWALLGEWLLVRIPLEGSDKIIVARIVHEEEKLK